MRSLLFLLLIAAPAAADFVWWEAETPARGDFPANNPFAPADAQQAEALSAGAWIGAEGAAAQGLFLEYEIDIPASGEYAFYARKFWKHGPFRWRFDDGPWREVGRDVGLLDAVELRLHVVANWVGLGAVQLAAGRRVLRIEVSEPGAVAFDAFVLTSEGFVPRGKLKPGERLGHAPDGFFAFEPGADSFGPEALLDLRFLNEAFAGERGYIRVRDGAFVHGDTGEPLRFWGVNAGPDLWRMDRPSIDYLARHLAKLGVNAVRVHGAVHDPEDLSRAQPQTVAAIQYFAQAMKREGIYTALSIYFPLWIQLGAGDGFPGYDGGHPFALLFFDETFQQYYKNWWRTLLTAPSPHGPPLAEDPAVALAELVNEDSYFFWTFTPYENIPAASMAVLERQFAAWLGQRYGSRRAALDAWGPPVYRGDEEGDDRVGFMPLWALFNNKTQRARDTAEFLTLHQRDFFARMKAYLQEELGFKGLVGASNWITADAAVLGPLDKYANAVGDYMDRHGYFAPPHDGGRAAWALSQGDSYADRRALQFQGGADDAGPSLANPVMDLAYNGLPSIISEINWPMPNRYRADMPLVSAAYGALQRSDGFFFFALSGPSWQRSHSKFSLQTPAVMGQFPAAALLYRLGLVEAGAPVYDIDVPLSRLLALEGAPARAPQNLDRLRAADVPAGGALSGAAPDALDPLAFLVGPVGLRVGGGGGPSLEADLSPYVDRAAGRVRSNTGQLAWDYAAGLVTVDAPAAQGATGFLRAAGPIRLGDVTIESSMEYGAIALVALDGRPLAASRRVLLQAMSEEANFGWRTTGGERKTIADLGGPPLVVREIAGRVEWHGRGPLRVIALDHNGYPADTLAAPSPIRLRAETLYYLIEPDADTGVGGLDDAAPARFVLRQNYPNPFNRGTVIDFVLPRRSEVRLAVYNLAGQKIVELEDAERPAGDHRMVWDGRDVHGRAMASGVYLLDLRAGERRQRRKMVLLR